MSESLLSELVALPDDGKAGRPATGNLQVPLARSAVHSNQLEQLLVDRLSEWRAADGPIVEYLLGCYGRLEAAVRTGGGHRVAQEVKYLLLSYTGLLLTMPAMFPQPPQYSATRTGLGRADDATRPS